MEAISEIRDFCISGETNKVLAAMKEAGYEPLSVKELKEYWRKRFGELAAKPQQDLSESEKFDLNVMVYVSLKKRFKKPLKNLFKRANDFFSGRRRPIHPNFYYCIDGYGGSFINTDLWGSINFITPGKKIRS